MHQDMDRIQDLIEYYRTQGAPADHQMLAALLKEIQEMDGGVLTGSRVCAVSEVYAVKENVLRALIRRIPGLHFEDAPHRLEICGSCRESLGLIQQISREYQVKSGSCSEVGKFVLQVTGCMKNCRQGPSVRWDGTLYSKADMNLIRELIRGCGKS